MELNKKESGLCAQALQSLLSLLQNLPPETFGSHSHSMVLQMHNLLKALRLEGLNLNEIFQKVLYSVVIFWNKFTSKIRFYLKIFLKFKVIFLK